MRTDSVFAINWGCQGSVRSRQAGQGIIGIDLRFQIYLTEPVVKCVRAGCKMCILRKICRLGYYTYLPTYLPVGIRTYRPKVGNTTCVKPCTVGFIPSSSLGSAYAAPPTHTHTLEILIRPAELTHASEKFELTTKEFGDD